MNKKKILLIDDDEKLTDIVNKYFSQYEFDVYIEHDGKDVLDKIMRYEPDVILLDVMLPEKSGFDVLKELQNKVHVPIIMLTAKGDEVDKVVGLELGADDYVTKPFSIRELVARIRTVLRRSAALNQDNSRKDIVSYRTLSINPEKRTLTIQEEEMELTKTEFEIFYLLAINPEKTFSREEILHEVSDRDYEVFDRSIDMHISHLRNKLKKQAEPLCSIKTVWGSGYRFEVKEK